MLKKISSLALVGFFAVSLSACSTTAPTNTKNEDVGINVKVDDKIKADTKATDTENVGVNIKVEGAAE